MSSSMRNIIISLILSMFFQSYLYAQQWSLKCPPGVEDYKTLHIPAWDSTLVFLGTYSNGVYKATIGEWDWQPCNDGLAEFNDTSFTINSTGHTNSHSFFGKFEFVRDMKSIMAGDGKLWALMTSMKFNISENGGNSWYLTDLSTYGALTADFFHVHSNNPDSILLTSAAEYPVRDIIFLSDDGGYNWELWNDGFNPPTFVQAGDNPNHLINGVWRSYDFGFSWEIVDTTGTTFIQLVTDRSNYLSQYGYTGSEVWTYLIGVTTDGGITTEFFGSTYNFQPSFVKLDRSGNFFWGSNDDLEKRINYGQEVITYDWYSQDSQYGMWNMRDMVSLDNNTNSAILADYNNVTVSNDELNSLEHIDDNFELYLVQRIFANPDNSNIISVGDYVTLNNGNDWIITDLASYEYYYSNNANSEKMHYIGVDGVYQKVQTSLDYGETREFRYYAEYGGLLGFTSSYFNENELYIAQNTTYPVHGYLTQSLDGGEDFEIIHTIYESIKKVYTHPTNPEILFFITDEDLHFSNDLAQTWRINNLPVSWQYVKDIKAGFPNEEELYLLSPDLLYHTENAGEDWEIIEPGFEMEYEHSLRYLVDGINFPDEMFIVVTGQGVVRWDFEDEWVMITPPEEWRVTCFDQAADGRYLVGTMKGIWIYDPNADVSTEPSKPQNFELLPIYPNPFNSTATVTFNLPQQSDIKLTIYNTLGQQVMTLLDKKMTSGKHSLKFNAEHLASGIYFLNLQTENFNSNQKIVLLR